VLDLYFNLTNKSNLMYMLLIRLITIFNHLVVAYFFGPPCIFVVSRLFVLSGLLRAAKRRKPCISIHFRTAKTT